MVIVSLVAAGVGLAIDAYSDRRARREGRRRDSDEQISGEINNGSQDTEQKRREQEAFNELQNYADFQSDLSTKVLDDLSREDAPMTYAGPSLPRQGPKNLGHKLMANPRIFHSGRLQFPIIIPQGTQDRDGCWARGYPRPLLEFGIDQHTFLNFLESFDVHIKLSTRLEAVNIAGSSSGIGWRDSPETFAKAIPSAVRVMKAYQSEQKSNSFLNHANALTFRPRGLFVMIITSRSSSPLQVISVEVPSSRTVQLYENDAQMSTEDGSSPLPEVDSTTEDFGTMDIDVQHSNQPLEQIPSNIGGQPNSRPTSSRSPFSSLLSTVAKHRERKNEIANKRIRRERRTPFRPSTALATALGNVPTRPGRLNHDVKPKWDSMTMEADALYLVIVNDPKAESSSPENSMDPYGYSTRNNSQVASGMMQRQQTSGSTSSKPTFYDPVYDASPGAPPAYTEK